MLQLKDEQLEEYFKKVSGIAEKAGCQVCHLCDKLIFLALVIVIIEDVNTMGETG